MTQDTRGEGDPKGVPDPEGAAQRKALAELAPGRDPATGKPRCTADSRTSGTRCKQVPVAGTTVCVYHGGKAPQVQRKARLRLLALVEPAVATLAREMTRADNKASDRLRAAENVLDRSGFPRAVKNVDEGEALELVIARMQEIRSKSATAADTEETK